jgi:DNA-binding SARP family transcriptional activator
MLQFGILGPLEVANGDGPVELGGQRQRTLLAALLLRANEVVPTDSLIDALWGERPPRTATTSLQNGVSQLRKLLGAAVLETRPPGYRLRIAPEELDAVRFAQLVQRSRAEPPEERAQTLAAALALWRGEPLADLAFERFTQEEIRRLGEERLLARVDLIDAELECGRHREVVSELEGLVEAHPLDERLRRQLMVALYRCGRQAEAMRTYHAARHALDDELGQPPGAELQAAYQAILQHADMLAAPRSSSQPLKDEYAEIVRALSCSRLVPVLGPAAGGSAPSPAPDPSTAAQHLAHVFGCPAERSGSLARVAQWVAIAKGVGPLYDELHTLYGQDFAPGPVHRSLAALPPLLRARGLPCQLLLSSGFDHMLEQAFSDAGEDFDVVSYVALGRDRGKFLHVTAEGETRLIDEPNLEVGVGSEERTLIVKLNGGTDELLGRVRDSYVVSEDDYIDYLAHADVSALLPIGLAARLRRSHLLFIGYALEEWSLRVFLRRLWGEERIAYTSWAIDGASDLVTAEQWHRFGVNLLAVPADEPLEELRRRLGTELAGDAR